MKGRKKNKETQTFDVYPHLSEYQYTTDIPKARHAGEFYTYDDYLTNTLPIAAAGDETDPIEVKSTYNLNSKFPNYLKEGHPNFSSQATIGNTALGGLFGIAGAVTDFAKTAKTAKEEGSWNINPATGKPYTKADFMKGTITNTTNQNVIIDTENLENMFDKNGNLIQNMNTADNLFMTQKEAQSKYFNTLADYHGDTYIDEAEFLDDGSKNLNFGKPLLSKQNMNIDGSINYAPIATTTPNPAFNPALDPHPVTNPEFVSRDFTGSDLTRGDEAQINLTDEGAERFKTDEFGDITSFSTTEIKDDKEKTVWNEYDETMYRPGGSFPRNNLLAFVNGGSLPKAQQFNSETGVCYNCGIPEGYPHNTRHSQMLISQDKYLKQNPYAGTVSTFMNDYYANIPESEVNTKSVQLSPDYWKTQQQSPAWLVDEDLRKELGITNEDVLNFKSQNWQYQPRKYGGSLPKAQQFNSETEQEFINDVNTQINAGHYVEPEYNTTEGLQYGDSSIASKVVNSATSRSSNDDEFSYEDDFVENFNISNAAGADKLLTNRTWIERLFKDRHRTVKPANINKKRHLRNIEERYGMNLEELLASGNWQLGPDGTVINTPETSSGWAHSATRGDDMTFNETFGTYVEPNAANNWQGGFSTSVTKDKNIEYVEDDANTYWENIGQYSTGDDNIYSNPKNAGSFLQEIEIKGRYGGQLPTFVNGGDLPKAQLLNSETTDEYNTEGFNIDNLITNDIVHAAESTGIQPYINSNLLGTEYIPYKKYTELIDPDYNPEGIYYPDANKYQGEIKRPEVDKLKKEIMQKNRFTNFLSSFTNEYGEFRREGGGVLPKAQFLNSELTSTPQDETNLSYKLSMNRPVIDSNGKCWANCGQRFFDPQFNMQTGISTELNLTPAEELAAMQARAWAGLTFTADQTGRTQAGLKTYLGANAGVEGVYSNLLNEYNIQPVANIVGNIGFEGDAEDMNNYKTYAKMVKQDRRGDPHKYGYGVTAEYDLLNTPGKFDWKNFDIGAYLNFNKTGITFDYNPATNMKTLGLQLGLPNKKEGGRVLPKAQTGFVFSGMTNKEEWQIDGEIVTKQAYDDMIALKKQQDVDAGKFNIFKTADVVIPDNINADPNTPDFASMQAQANINPLENAIDSSAGTYEEYLTWAGDDPYSKEDWSQLNFENSPAGAPIETSWGDTPFLEGVNKLNAFTNTGAFGEARQVFENVASTGTKIAEGTNQIIGAGVAKADKMIADNEIGTAMDISPVIEASRSDKGDYDLISGDFRVNTLGYGDGPRGQIGQMGQEMNGNTPPDYAYLQQFLNNMVVGYNPQFLMIQANKGLETMTQRKNGGQVIDANINLIKQLMAAGADFEML